MPTSSLRHTDLALVLLVLLVGVSVAGCREAAEDAAAPPPAANGESTDLPLDGDGMEPRISIDQPIDAPGRPADGADDRTQPPAAGGEAAWVPELTVADLEASIGFYRDLGFTLADGQREEPTARRVELARDGVRLVLVAAAPEPTVAAEPAPDAPPAGGPAEPANTTSARPMVLLHLAETGADGDPRTVRDPDGHRLVLPGGR